MAFRIARVGIEDDITVDLAVGGVGSGEGSQHRTIDGSGAVGPGQGVGEVPQDAVGIVPGGGEAIAEDLIAAELNGRPGDVDENGGRGRGNDIDAVELGQRKP